MEEKYKVESGTEIIVYLVRSFFMLQESSAQTTSSTLLFELW